MPRPQKCRRVCALPRWAGFAPMGGNCHRGTPPVSMRVDEYEVIRLMDLEGMTQEECAAQMEIARTTVTGIYESARRKLAESLVEGRPLIIGGGSYRLCDGGHCARHKGGCCEKHKKHGGEQL